MVDADREFYGLGGHNCYFKQNDEDHDCVICLDSLSQKVSFLDPSAERMNLSVNRMRPHWNCVNLRPRKVEHAGAVVGRFESGTESLLWVRTIHL